METKKLSRKKWVRSRKSFIWIGLQQETQDYKTNYTTGEIQPEKIQQLHIRKKRFMAPLARLQGPRGMAAGAEPPPATGASTVAAGLRQGSVPPARVRVERMPAAEAFVSAATSHPCALRLQAPPVPRLPRGITLLIPRALMRDFLNKILR